MTEFVRLEVENGVGTVRLDRPPVNAFNRQLQEELYTVAQEAATRADVRSVSVYGGERAFAAGADIKEMAAMPYAEMAVVARRLNRCFGAISEIPKPTVAAITGYALGGGMEVALGCDRRIAGDNAKLGQPEILLGVIPGGGGTQRMARLIGPSRTKDLVYSGRTIKAAEALEIGLVDEVVAPDDVYAAAQRWAVQFANGPALALAAAKRVIDNGLDTDLRTGLDLEADAFAALFATQDRTIGMESFVEDGPGKAEFSGS